MKNVQIRSFFCSVFSRIRAKYGKIWTRKYSVFGHFSLSECSDDEVGMVVNSVRHFNKVQFPEYFLRLHTLKETQFMTVAAKSSSNSHIEKWNFEQNINNELILNKRFYLGFLSCINKRCPYCEIYNSKTSG